MQWCLGAGLLFVVGFKFWLSGAHAHNHWIFISLHLASMGSICLVGGRQPFNVKTVFDVTFNTPSIGGSLSRFSFASFRAPPNSPLLLPGIRSLGVRRVFGAHCLSLQKFPKAIATPICGGREFCRVLILWEALRTYGLL